MAVQIQLRRGLAAAWTSANPTLAAGEMAIETDTDFYKIGDGSTAWTSLGYSSLPSGTAPLASPTFTGTVTMADLVVNGTTSTINSTTLTVDDKNIELGSVASPSDTTADGGGITLKGASDKTFNWVDSTDAWTSSEHVALATGKSVYIDGVLQLSKNALAATVVLADGVLATTQSANDSSTKVATTAFVMTEVGDYLTTATASSTYSPLASPTFTGTVNAAALVAPLAFNTQTASYTLVLADAGKAVLMNVGSANNLTIPPNSSVAFDVGTQIIVTMIGAGVTTIVDGSGVTTNSKDNNAALDGQFTSASLVKTATDTWLVTGALA